MEALAGGTRDLRFTTRTVRISGRCCSNVEKKEIPKGKRKDTDGWIEQSIPKPKIQGINGNKKSPAQDPFSDMNIKGGPSHLAAFLLFRLITQLDWAEKIFQRYHIFDACTNGTKVSNDMTRKTPLGLGFLVFITTYMPFSIYLGYNQCQISEHLLYIFLYLFFSLLNPFLITAPSWRDLFPP